jgi:hypothetical protein
MRRMTLFTAVLALLGACGDDDGASPDAGVRNDGGGTEDAGPPPGDAGEPAVDFLDPEFGNRDDVDPMLAAATNLTAPDFVPAAGSPAGMMAGTPPAGLEAAAYVGAFEPAGEDWTDGWTSFPEDGEPTETMTTGCADPETGTEVMVMADITAATTWSCDNIYVLGAPVYVSAVLTIEPGTIVRGAGGANALIITTAGRLEAAGTAEQPIVFTSDKSTGRMPGDWGGVVLLGTAPINVAGGTNEVEGLMPGEARGTYGGTNAAHDCGTLSYARIEYAGFVFGEDNELNGLTVAGCGTGTTLDHIQVHLGLDDGIEFFGGTASIDHAIVTRAGDDGIDWDQGWAGNGQFLVVQQDNVGDQAFECDNLDAMNDATPRSSPTIWNVTVVGTNGAEQRAMRLRRGTAGDIGNGIFLDYGMQSCIFVEGGATIAQAEAGELSIRNSIFDGCMSAFSLAP